ncbi:allophanate hydrolase [Pelagibius marinus]|uniref:allophanate hydrolase n=1 Tax=Pelagibius marinus TaxID=2762760 RepID=UPI001872EFFF|nr:allophanate hydrolase [Pelagibius marinus]
MQNDFTIAALHTAYGAGTGAGEVVEEIERRIAAVDDPGIFISRPTAEQMKAEISGLGPFDPVAKPLWGIPFAVKDNIDVAGMETTAACPDFAYRAKEDATVVRRLRNAGAFIIGKTNLDQFATGLVGLRTPYPAPRNALDDALIPGGSSAGSAVAVARALCSFSLGTDTAGSGRIPAGLNGLVGLKPSFGAISTQGVVPACRTLDCVSIFARSPADASAAFAEARGYDPADPYSRVVPAGDAGAPAQVQRIGVPRYEDRVFFGDEAAAAGYQAAVERLAEMGLEITQLPFDAFYRVARLLYEGAWVAERYAAIEAFITSRPEALHPVTRAIIEGASAFSAADAFKAGYQLAALRRETRNLMQGIDALCVPTAPTWYTVEEVLAEPLATNSNLGTYTNFVNLLGLCGMTVPVGRREDGRPESVTFLGRDGADAQVAQLAGSFLAGPVPTSNDTAKRIGILVVGAHMSGLSLNGQLTALDGQFEQATKTAADYCLYALPDSEPAKPGLLRVQPGRGTEIEAELWSLTEEAFGAFVAALPPPMCIGNVKLVDGRLVKGFLVESVAVDMAHDISQFGGWRGFVAAQ